MIEFVFLLILIYLIFGFIYSIKDEYYIQNLNSLTTGFICIFWIFLYLKESFSGLISYLKETIEQLKYFWREE